MTCGRDVLHVVEIVKLIGCPITRKTGVNVELENTSLLRQHFLILEKKIAYVDVKVVELFSLVHVI